MIEIELYRPWNGFYFSCEMKIEYFVNNGIREHLRANNVRILDEDETFDPTKHTAVRVVLRKTFDVLIYGAFNTPKQATKTIKTQIFSQGWEHYDKNDNR